MGVQRLAGEGEGRLAHGLVLRGVAVDEGKRRKIEINKLKSLTCILLNPHANIIAVAIIIINQ